MIITKKLSHAMIAFFLLTGIAIIISCNSKFPPPAPPGGSYGEALWKIDHFIKNERALQLISNFKSNKEALLNGKYNGNSKVLFDHETFNLRDISQLLKTKGCIGLRVNLGMDENNQVRLVLIGVDKDGKELVLNGGIGSANDPDRGGRTGIGGAGVAPPDPGKSYVEEGQRWP
ncbi:MAG: hypothetical protein JNL23_05570 [Chitinophagaceae bacterium]|nr:hypothetical protein [Chitinophagaceae bacterium]